MQPLSVLQSSEDFICSLVGKPLVDGSVVDRHLAIMVLSLKELVEAFVDISHGELGALADRRFDLS